MLKRGQVNGVIIFLSGRTIFTIVILFDVRSSGPLKAPRVIISARNVLKRDLNLVTLEVALQRTVSTLQRILIPRSASRAHLLVRIKPHVRSL